MKFKREKSSAIDDVSIITERMEIQGHITTSGSIRLDGKVFGDIQSGGNVTIGDAGEVHGNITAQSLTNGGIVIGNLVVTEKITLESKSQLKGDLVGRILVIEEGAAFIGRSDMSQPEPAKNE